MVGVEPPRIDRRDRLPVDRRLRDESRRMGTAHRPSPLGRHSLLGCPHHDRQNPPLAEKVIKRLARL